MKTYPASYDDAMIEAVERLNYPMIHASRSRRLIYVADQEMEHRFFPRHRNVYTFRVKGYPIIRFYGKVR